MKLYELVGAYQQVQSLLEEGHDVQDTLASIEASLEEKIDATCKVKLNMEAQIHAMKEEEKRLQEKRKSLESQVDGLLGYLAGELEKIDVRKFRAGVHLVQFEKCPPSVEVTDQSLIPREYIKQEIILKVDRVRMYKKLKSGEPIAGVRYVTDKMKLRIK